MGQVVSNNINPSTGNPTGYKVLTPSFGRNTLFAHPDSPVAQRAAASVVACVLLAQARRRKAVVRMLPASVVARGAVVV